MRRSALPAAETASSALLRRNLTGWLLAISASMGADEIFYLALTFAAIQVAAPGQVGVIVAIGAVPRLLVLFFGGSLSDRVSSRAVMVAADAGRAVVLLAAAAAFVWAAMPVWALVAVSLIVCALDGLFMPAGLSLPARIAPAHLMTRAAAVRTVVSRIVIVAAGPFTGLLMVWQGPALAFAAAGVLFVLSCAALSLIRLLPTHPAESAGAADITLTGPAGSAGTAGTESVPDRTTAADRLKASLADVAGGLAVMRRNPVLPWLLLLTAAGNFGFVGPVFVGLPLLAAGRGWGPGGAGVLIGAFAAGAAACALLMVFVKRLPHAGLAIVGSVFTMGVTLALFAATSSFMWVGVAAFTLGASSGVVSTLVHGLLLAGTPEEDLGRVMSLVSFALEGALPLSYAAAGVVTATLGPNAVFVGGGAVMVASALAAATRRPVRELEQHDDATT